MEVNGFKESLIETKAGVFLDILNPDPNLIDIGGIAHSLSNQCRFSGWTNRHYSIAEHSVNISYLVPREDAFTALMHDATEAFLVDIPSPIKKLWPAYYAIEQNLWNALRVKWPQLPEKLPAEVKTADARICITEKIWLIGEKGLDNSAWTGLMDHFKPYQPEMLFTHDEGDEMEPRWAGALFLERFKELTNGPRRAKEIREGVTQTSTVSDYIQKEVAAWKEKTGRNG